MKAHLIAAALALTTTAALAQTTPGERFLQSWDLDESGAATPSELREMRGRVFSAFDADENGLLSADEYVYFDEARANDVATYEGGQRDRMQSIADGLGLAANDTDADGAVGREEFVAGADGWFARLDKNGDGAITVADFPM